MLEALNLKEKMAIELKYLGNSYSEISEKIDIDSGTLANWFSVGGRLYDDYLSFAKKMNTSRDKTKFDGSVEMDINIAKLTTNVIRQFGQQVLAHGKRLLEVDKDNNPVLDKDGRSFILEFSKPISVKDFVEAWKVQRILTGRNTDSVEVSEYNKEKVEEQIEAMRQIINAKTEKPN